MSNNSQNENSNNKSSGSGNDPQNVQEVAKQLIEQMRNNYDNQIENIKRSQDEKTKKIYEDVQKLEEKHEKDVQELKDEISFKEKRLQHRINNLDKAIRGDTSSQGIAEQVRYLGKMQWVLIICMGLLAGFKIFGVNIDTLFNMFFSEEQNKEIQEKETESQNTTVIDRKYDVICYLEYERNETIDTKDYISDFTFS